MEAVIVGVGLHPFGRFPGKSAMDMARRCGPGRAR